MCAVRTVILLLSLHYGLENVVHNDDIHDVTTVPESYRESQVYVFKPSIETVLLFIKTIQLNKKSGLITSPVTIQLFC